MVRLISNDKTDTALGVATAWENSGRKIPLRQAVQMASRAPLGFESWGTPGVDIGPLVELVEAAVRSAGLCEDLDDDMQTMVATSQYTDKMTISYYATVYGTFRIETTKAKNWPVFEVTWTEDEEAEPPFAEDYGDGPTFEKLAESLVAMAGWIQADWDEQVENGYDENERR